MRNERHSDHEYGRISINTIAPETSPLVSPLNSLVHIPSHEVDREDRSPSRSRSYSPSHLSSRRSFVVNSENEPATKEGGNNSYSKRPRNSYLKRFGHFGWWWEIGSALFTIACTALIIAILFSMDGKPIEKWKFRSIQPNSLVAIFSTLAKSSLLFPIAECMGQLKWSYFKEPGPVSQLQRFDTASRGPWGAALLLWHVRGRAFLASLGAVVTVLLLAFEPFAQQV
jgi:hypothetical protein